MITLSEILVYKQADEPDKSKRHFEARKHELETKPRMDGFRGWEGLDKQ